MLRSSLSKLAQPARRYVYAGVRHASSSANGGGARFCRLGAAAGAVGAVGLYATWQVTTGGRPLASDAPPAREKRAGKAAGTEDRPLDAKSALEPAALESAAEEIAETPKPKRSYARKTKSDAPSADPSSDAPTSASSSPALDGPPSESEPPAETPADEGSDETHTSGEGAGGGQGGAFNPETGEINWDCPCLGGMAHGPCGAQFREAFSCFIYSEQEPKGIDCVEGFKRMQDCFREHPDVYAEEIMDDDDEGEQPMTTQDGEPLQVPEPASTPVPETIPASPIEAPQTSRTRREQESSAA